jgi:hypothetical protein
MVRRKKGMTRVDGNPAREDLVARPFTYPELVDYQVKRLWVTQSIGGFQQMAIL